jgi:hypothetical protein
MPPARSIREALIARVPLSPKGCRPSTLIEPVRLTASTGLPIV